MGVQLFLFAVTPAERAAGKRIIRLKLTDYVQWDHTERRWITRIVIEPAVVLKRWSDMLFVRLLRDGKTVQVDPKRIVPDGPCRAALLALVGPAPTEKRRSRRRRLNHRPG